MFKVYYGNKLYLFKYITFGYRSDCAKWIWGVSLLKIETGWYENKDVNEWVCFMWNDEIKNSNFYTVSNYSIKV